MYRIFLFVTIAVICESAQQIYNCKHQIFCTGELLRVIQSAGIFKDSKTFVDMSLIGTTEGTLKAFEHLMVRTQSRPTKNDIIEFVQTHFQASSTELEHWFPTDYQPSPPFIRKIKDLRARNFAVHLLNVWPNLGRRIKSDVLQNPYKYTIIPVPNGFIIPGGRFREFYYWDSYWIIRGLLICEMKFTAKGMIENFFRVIHLYGFIPNGGRIYYLDRSQPPLLTLMVADLFQATSDVLWLKNNINYLEKELKYWLNTKVIQFEKDGKKYRMARYLSTDDTPRPESYIEDVHTASAYRTEDEKRKCFTNLRTGAETGWDFSGRWFFDKQGGNRGDLSTIQPSRIIPVDLNAILCKSFKVMYEFHQHFRNTERMKFWHQKWKEWQHAILMVFYNQEDGIWYDYDTHLKIQRKYFYGSNFAPLWLETYNTDLRDSYGLNCSLYVKKIGIGNFEGGIPSSLFETGEQWDLPNAWAPLQGMVIFGLEQTGNSEAQRLARLFAAKWFDSTLKVLEDTKELFEKYNGLVKGMYGGGGEYEVQTGFGWTNGFILELIEHYYIKKREGL